MLELEAPVQQAIEPPRSTLLCDDTIPRATSNGHVLVIEDHAGLNQALGIRLRARGFVVSSAYDGAEGLSHSIRFKPDLIILDMGLPKVSGTRVLCALREHAVATDIPIVIVTGRRELELFDFLLGWKAIHRVFYKPTPAARIAAVVSEILEDRTP